MTPQSSSVYLNRDLPTVLPSRDPHNPPQSPLFLPLTPLVPNSPTLSGMQPFLLNGQEVLRLIALHEVRE